MNEESMLEETDDAKMDAKRRRTRIAVASGLGFLVMLVVVLGLRSRGAAPPGEGTVATNDTAAAPALPAPRAIAPSGSGEAVAANIPLFGTTPLSTTEPAPMPLDPKMAQAPAAETPDPASDEPKNDKPGAMSFGKGKVVHAKTVKLKMDAPIGEIKGSVDGKTLTLSIPGRRNVEPASTLAKKDKRIASVKAVPKDGGVDVTVTFKDTPPPFLAKASGKLLELELGEAKASGGADDDATEAKTKKHKKSKAVAKKGDHKKKHKKSDD